jgi:hypothetical protein
MSGGLKVDGYPSITETVVSGQTRKLTAGRYMVRPLAASLVRSVLDRSLVEVTSERRVEVKLCWVARDVEVEVHANGQPIQRATAPSGLDPCLRGRAARHPVAWRGRLGTSLPRSSEMTDRTSSLTIWLSRALAAWLGA